MRSTSIEIAWLIGMCLLAVPYVLIAGCYHLVGWLIHLGRTLIDLNFDLERE